MLRAILAGILIGIGDIAIITIDNPYMSALIFALALLSIVCLNLPLYTGRIGKVIENHNLLGCIVLLVFNSIGVVISLLCFICMDSNNYKAIIEVADTKFTSIPAMFFAGVLCNVLIHIAVTSKRELVVILCVMGFILCGFEHSIADAGYALVSLNIRNIGLWLVVAFGNAVGGITTEYMLINRKKEKGKTI